MATAAEDDSELHHHIIVEGSGNDLITDAEVVTEDFLKSSVAGVIDTSDTFPIINGSQQKQTIEIEESDTHEKLAGFWTRQMEEVQSMTNNDFKTQDLPLARIKKIMKMDEDVKMISAEAPLLFSKAAQLFIAELSLRAWVHTEESKRRTLQRNDIAAAISKFDQFDFLIDIVPREELKSATPKRPFSGGGHLDTQQLVYLSHSNSSSNNPTAALGQAPTQLPGIRTGQLLIAQQNQSGQPLTLTPINIDNTQILQVLQQPSQQAQSIPQQQAQQQQSQTQQQFTPGVVLSPTPTTIPEVAEAQPSKQVQINQVVSASDQTQISQQQSQQQSIQAILQQLIGNNITTGQGEVHTLQLNAQGQLQLVKVPNQVPHEQVQTSASEPINSRQQQTVSSQLFDLSSAMETNSGHSTLSTVYVTPNQ